MTKGPADQLVVLNDTDNAFNLCVNSSCNGPSILQGAKQLSLGVLYLAQVNISWAARTVKTGLQRMSLKEPATSTWSYGFLCCMLEATVLVKRWMSCWHCVFWGHMQQQYTFQFQTARAAVCLRTMHLWVTQSPWATLCYCKRSGIDTDQQWKRNTSAKDLEVHYHKMSMSRKSSISQHVQLGKT